MSSAEKLSNRSKRATPEEAAQVLEPEPLMHEKQAPEKEQKLIAQNSLNSIQTKATNEQIERGRVLQENEGRKRMSDEQMREEEPQHKGRQ
ncbi:MAG: hypothetical protein JO076_01600 [Verrucomicrobia bacterium]|nr:hypothetical protein [Verrucomicrobiota bacterium]